MNKIAIIQPCKIGDIIICLPIAKYFHDNNNAVYWPIKSCYYEMFKRHIDYVEFIPIDNDHSKCIENSRIAVKECDIIDISFHFPNTDKLSIEYNNQRSYTFDEFKYKLANVPFDNKWNLEIKRDLNREMSLYNKLIKNKDFIVYQNTSSDWSVKYDLNREDKKFDIVNVKDYTDDIFDWITILEKSNKLILVESCFSNLVDQLHIKTDKILLAKHGYYGPILEDNKTPKGMPRLRENWNII